MNINMTQLVKGDNEDVYYVDASDLGWEPGYFPTTFTLESENGFFTMERTSLKSDCARYHNVIRTFHVTVFND